MLMRGEVCLAVCLIAVEVSDRSQSDVVCGDDAILRLLHFKLSLVVLCLGIGALLESSKLILISRIEMEDLAEKFVCLQEGIKVASNNDLIFGKVLLQSQQIFLQVLDLHLIFFRA